MRYCTGARGNEKKEGQTSGVIRVLGVARSRARGSRSMACASPVSLSLSPPMAAALARRLSDDAPRGVAGSIAAMFVGRSGVISVARRAFRFPAHNATTTTRMAMSASVSSIFFNISLFTTWRAEEWSHVVHFTTAESLKRRKGEILSSTSSEMTLRSWGVVD